MKSSLQTRVSLFITLTVVVISVVSTYLFTTTHTRSKERGLMIRGTALSYSLSKAAEEGLVKEDLSLIKKASYIIQAPDVTLAQVYSGIWEPIDAYPPGDRNTPPHPEAVGHFKGESTPFQIRIADGYDFYAPIIFKPLEDSRPAVVGFVRMTLSTAALQREVRNLAFTNIAVSSLITLIAILSLNFFVRRLVIRPVKALHQAVSRFKDGVLPEDMGISRQSADELRELAGEFRQMCAAVKDKESRLIESDRRIRSLFERAEHAIFRTDGSGKISEANGKFRSMFGGVTGLCDILIGDTNTANCLRRAASEKVLHLEDKAISRSGDELSIALSLYAEWNDAGGLAGFDGYIIDVTEKKQLEERLMRSQKLEAVGTLAAGMAHDFNNLLTAVLGYSGIMLKQVPKDDPLYKPVTVIHEAAKRGAELGRKILTIARKVKTEVKPVNLNSIVTQSAELLRTSIPGNIEIVTRLCDQLPGTAADQSQLHQMIVNLAVNARDAMPDGGRLTLETSPASPVSGRGRLSGASTSGFITLSVSDTGVGIDTETQAKIFDPFFTTKEVGKGTGLGLYTVHSIVSNHGGYINVSSEPGQGTRFNVFLPVAKEDAVEAAPVAADFAKNRV